MQSKRVVAIVEARMTSSRLPGKHLLEALGRPMIGHLIRRLQAVSSLSDIVIAMTQRSNDDVLEEYLNGLGVNVFRGDEDDVMGRVLGAARAFDADVICEVTGDCPIIDPVLVEHAIQTFLLNPTISYLNNGRYGLPDGMGCQVFSVEALAESERQTDEPLDREHVTLHIKRNPGRFPAIYLPALSTCFWPELAVTLDEQDDYVLLKRLIEHFGDDEPLFSCDQVVRFLKSRPEWVEINRSVIRKGEG